jgi:TET-Associated Glycosyltransferase
MNPRFPIYIVSKGRADTRLTSRHFEAIGVPYHVVIEEQEFAQYAAVIDKTKLLVLDKAYQRNYDALMKLAPEESRGSGPARNFAGDHSRTAGAAWHWVMDDNIRQFFRFHNNYKIRIGDGTMLRVLEDFVLRYKNVAMAGPNYATFCPRKRDSFPPYILNSRIYSCNLIRNDVPYRWRGRYNEDTILSLDMLKAGWCLVQFNALLQDKAATLSMKGGNTDEIYKGGSKNLEKSQMLVAAHPDCCRIRKLYGRWHHYADYTRFKRNGLVLRDDIEQPRGIDEYGMQIVQIAA